MKQKSKEIQKSKKGKISELRKAKKSPQNTLMTGRTPRGSCNNAPFSEGFSEGFSRLLSRRF